MYRRLMIDIEAIASVDPVGQSMIDIEAITSVDPGGDQQST